MGDGIALRSSHNSISDYSPDGRYEAPGIIEWDSRYRLVMRMCLVTATQSQRILVMGNSGGNNA